MASSDDHEPVNLLSLDGGGVRGVSELVILDELMKEVQRQGNLNSLPKPCDYFHLIGGTSTGGLVAIMLGRLKMSTTEALEEYDNFGKKIFSFWNRKVDPAERFGAKRLQKTVSKIVAKRGATDGMRDPENPKKGKAFVCATSAKGVGSPRRLRTYEVDDDHWDKNCKIWEAARATSAAPTYFKPMTIHGADGQPETFIDAAMGCNNPSEWLLKEAGEIFDTNRKLGCIVSLGTGTSPRGLERASSALKTIPWGFKMLSLMKDIVVDCEATHGRMLSDFQEFPGTYFRFNVPDGAKGVGTGDHSKMGMLKKITREYVQNVAMEDIRKVADVLRNQSSIGLSVGHVCRLNKDNIVMNVQNAVPQGTSSRHFVGRDDILRRLQEYFSPLQPEGSQTRRQFLLHGMGGVGKTQIALKFLEAVEKEERFRTFWVDASDRVTTEQHFKDFAAILFPGEKTDSSSILRVLDWLKTTKEEWIIVYDNFQDRESWDMTQYIPSGDKGNILFTSRESTHALELADECVAHVEVMGNEDSITLLLAAAKIPRESPHQRTMAEPIVKELGNLPLAVDQAGAYVRMTDIPLKDYLGIFQARKKELLTSDRYLLPTDPRRVAVYTSFDISYNTVVEWTKAKKSAHKAKHARSALQVLTMICFYHNEGVMRDTVRRAAEKRGQRHTREHYPLPGDDLCLEELLDVDEIQIEDKESRYIWKPDNFETGCRFLHEFALAKQDRTGNHISMHVLVHSWARDTMKDAVREQQSLAARIVLLDSISFGEDWEDAYYRTKMIPHVMACDEYVTAQHPDERLESEFATTTGKMAEKAGQYEIAERAFRRARDNRIHILGEDHDHTLKAQMRLGSVLGDMARYDEGEDILKDVLARRIRISGQNHPKTSSARTALAGLYSHACLVDRTEELVREVIEARTEQMRNGDETVSYWSLRGILDHIQALKAGGPRSIQLSEETLAAAERMRPSDHSTVLYAKSCLASALMANGEQKEAEKLYKEVYTHYLEQRGLENKETLNSLDNFSKCLFEQGRWIESWGLSQTIYETSEKILGAHSLDTLGYRSSFAACLAIQGYSNEALEHLYECSRLMDEIMGPNHFHSVMTKKMIAEVQYWQPQITPAVKQGLRKRAIHASYEALGDDAPDWLREEEARNQAVLRPSTLPPQVVSREDDGLYD